MGEGLTVRCSHQGLELLSLSRGLGPGTSSHGNLRSSSSPVARKRSVISPRFVVYSVSSLSV